MFCSCSIVFTPFTQFNFFLTGPELAYTTMATDIRITCGLNRLAGTIAAALISPVYRYVVTGRPSSPVMYYGSKYDATLAFSGFDLLALLDTLDKVMSGTRPNSKDVAFGNLLRNNFVNFVETGRPAYLAWQKFPNNTALYSDKQNIENGVYHTKECTFFEQNGLVDYSWQN